MPNTLLTASIQPPERGSDIENPASAQNGRPKPTAYVDSSRNPYAASRVVATYARIAASGGPVQGAAMMPPTTPIRNAPPNPRPPTRDSRACSGPGTASSKAPNIDSAMATKNSASGTITQGLARNVPNALPSSANTVPSVPNMAAMPAT